MSASGRTVVVIGCTRGIGRALFEWFCKMGEYNVAGCGTDKAELKALQAAWSASQSYVCEVNIRDEADVSSWLKGVAKRFTAVDVLICCAGYLPKLAEFHEISDNDWRLACEVNVVATAKVLRHAVPVLRTPGATVVIFSSRYGRSVVKNQAAYCASKWGTEGMAKALALELVEKGITVVPLDPGVVNTAMLQKSSPGPEGAKWCSQQQSPDDFAQKAAPFILSLTIADTGRSLTSPGSPEHYFQTGVAYKDRPAWANGIGPFVRAVDDVAPVAKRARTSEDSRPNQECTQRKRTYFISGVMGGSSTKLHNKEDLASQDYRARISQIIGRVDPVAHVVDPMDRVVDRAASQGLTIDQLLRAPDNSTIRGAFEDVVDLASQCDVVISNLPEASMGSAVELWEAKKMGRTVLTVSPMAGNWLIRSVSDHNFSDLEDLERNLHIYLPGLNKQEA